MKYQNYLLSAAILLLGACSSEKGPWSEKTSQLVKVSFNIELEPEIISFGTKAMPGGLPPEPESESGSETENPTDETDDESSTSLLKTVEFAVYDQDLNLIKHQSIEVTDPNTINITDVFEAGIYNFCFIAHPYDGLTVEENNITFPTDLKECFYSSKELEVEVGTDFNETITLDRIVSKIEIVAKDELPEKVKSYRISASGIYNTFDILNGYATTSTVPFSRTVSFSTEDYSAATGPTHSFYSFVPETDMETEHGTISEIKLETLNEKGELLREKVINNAPIYVNRITKYVGSLYNVSSNASIVFEINSDWGETIENNIEE